MQFIRRYASVTLALAAMLLFAGLIGPGTLRAQEQAPAATAPAAPVQVASETLALDHVHLNVPDPAAAVAWYTKYLGAKPGPAGEPNDRVLFGQVRLIFAKAENPLPSQGSTLDFIGFSFPDVDAQMKIITDAGIKVDSPIRDVPGMFKLGFIEDPWGTRIEIVQDPELLGLHHIHISVPDTEAAFAWFLQNFGGVRSKMKGRLDAMQYSGVWMVIQKANRPTAPSAGHVIDHYGFRTTMDIHAKEAELKAKGVSFSSEPMQVRNLWAANINGPEGVKLELVQRPN